MKSMKLVALFFAAMWLAGCSSTSSREGLEGAGDVAIDDMSVNSAGFGTNGASGSDMGGTAGRNGGMGFDDPRLNDPNSLLSRRVIYFDYDSAVVRMEDQAVLEAHAAYLSSNPSVRVRLEGHTDERGSREYNLALGERRALSIRQALMLQGASTNQFQVVSFGEERPAVDGSGEGVWQQNRRVEIVYTGR